MQLNTGLPVEEIIDDLRRALAENTAAVLAAPPGAGKTTVVPLALHGESWLGSQRIVMLEPRRVATRAAATRMASLAGVELGGLIGYRTRDDRRTSKATEIEVVTEGILTRRLQNDPDLPGVGLIIFDEFHERSVQADLGLALALDSQRSLRSDLRLLVMSATLDTEPVAALLGVGAPAPIVSSQGRQHPVDVRWMPRASKERIAPAMANAIRTALFETEGDVLAFLPGAGEIRQVARLLEESPLVSTEPVRIRPLFGALPAAEQDQAIRPSQQGERKVVLATDIAETSLTIDGVTVVVDSGLRRTPRFDPRTALSRLDTVAISKASAEQRAGRAGRTSPGIAYRLWSKVEHASRPGFTAPEITETDLAPVLLDVIAWGATTPAELPLLDQPREKEVDLAAELLWELGAIDRDRRLTEHGKQIARLPAHPRLAHMIVTAHERGQGAVGCAIAALLEDRDILRGRPDEVETGLGVRLEILLGGGTHHPQLDRRARQRAEQSMDDLMRRIGATTAGADLSTAGWIAALAYPDRIGRSRRPGGGTYKLRSGSGAWLEKTDPLSHSEFIVAIDLDGRGADKRIRMAVTIDETDIDLVFADQIDETTTVRWDKQSADVVEVATRRIGKLALKEHRTRPQPGPEVVEILTNQAKSSGLKILPWTDTARAVQSRIHLVRQALGTDWPDLSDTNLRKRPEDWLAPYLTDARGKADLDVLDMAGILLDQLSWENRRDLDRLAPTHLEVPSGSRIRLDYSADEPVLPVKLQEMFGALDTPTLVDGRVPVVLHLLSPAQRPIQITQDLAGFWAGSYAQVRAEMRGRYPKHHWPEDPASATPRRKTTRKDP